MVKWQSKFTGSFELLLIIHKDENIYVNECVRKCIFR